MLLFMVIAISSAIGIRVGIVKNNKRLLKTSWIVLLVDIALFIIGSVMYAIYE
jgi:hypothetical protein